MSSLDNPTAPPAAAPEPPAAPLDGIESPAEGGAEHLPRASAEAAPEHLPDAPVEASPSAAAPTSALSAPAAGEEAPAAEPVLEPPLNSLRKNNGDARLSQGKVVIQTAAPRERATSSREPSRR